MRFWWVSQNKTYQHEAAGGYLWSPQTNSKGQRNAAYDFMTEIAPGDVVFSFAGSEIRAIGVAETRAYGAPKPEVFGRAGDTWDDLGWKVDVFYHYVDNPPRPVLHMKLLRPLLPEKYSPLRDDGIGNQQYLFPIPTSMAEALLALCGLPEWPTITDVSPALNALMLTTEDNEIITAPDLEETEKSQLVQARRGQGRFRNHVRAIERQCRVTGVSSENLLIASHIKPWRSSSNQERLDGNNGLFLSPHIDKLFDSHLISFSSRGNLLISDLLDSTVLEKWSIDREKNYGRFNSSQEYFLSFHRETLETKAEDLLEKFN